MKNAIEEDDRSQNLMIFRLDESEDERTDTDHELDCGLSDSCGISAYEFLGKNKSFPTDPRKKVKLGKL